MARRNRDVYWKRTNYFRAHQRVRELRGAARVHRCITCRRKATAWSYSHQRASLLKLKVYRDGRMYSNDPTEYDPRCNRCHYRYDRGCLCDVCLLRYFRVHGEKHPSVR